MKCKCDLIRTNRAREYVAPVVASVFWVWSPPARVGVHVCLLCLLPTFCPSGCALVLRPLHTFGVRIM